MLCSGAISQRSKINQRLIWSACFLLSWSQGGSHRVSMSAEEKDPFRFRHMIPTDALQVRALANAGT